MPSTTPAWSTKCSTVRSQKIVRYLWAFARTPTTSSVNPFGGRNSLGRGAPARWIAAAPLSISRITAGGERSSRSGWSKVWLAISSRAWTSAFTRSGCASALRPTRKNVAWSWYVCRRSRTSGVQRGSGPSSKVSATIRRPVCTRNTPFARRTRAWRCARSTDPPTTSATLAPIAAERKHASTTDHLRIARPERRDASACIVRDYCVDP